MDHRLLSRRSLLAAAVAVPALALVAAACGDDDAAGTPDDTAAPPEGGPTTTTHRPAGAIEHPTDPSEAVLRLTYEGGLVMPSTAFVNTPALVVGGDGRAYTPAATTLEFPGPLVAPTEVRSLDEAALQRVLALADAAGLLGPDVPDYAAELNVADAPATVLVIHAKGRRVEHRADALGLAVGPDGSSDEVTPARAALLAFVEQVTDLAALAPSAGPAVLLEPAAYRIRSYPTSPEELAAQDPQPAVVDWPATAGVRLADALAPGGDGATGAGCVGAPATAVGPVLGAARQTTAFREDERLYTLAAAPVLPGDPVC